MATQDKKISAFYVNFLLMDHGNALLTHSLHTCKVKKTSLSGDCTVDKSQLAMIYLLVVLI